MATLATGSIYIARSTGDALFALADLGPAAEVVAGATWVMRAPLRHESQVRPYVALSKISELRTIAVSDVDVTIGSCVTHAELAERIEKIPELRGLAIAAGKSANPAIRRVATVGGNLCTPAFAAADLVPALLSLDAEVDYLSAGGPERIGLDEFLASRTTTRSKGLLARVIVPRRKISSTHVRLPLRKAGDYPVAIVSATVERRADGIIERAGVAVGSVEGVARRWTNLELAIVGSTLEPAAISDQAAALADDFIGRDGIEAPGWYRVKVLPTLVRRAFEALKQP